MNTRFLVAFLTAASLSGCVIYGGGGDGGGNPPADPGDVTFEWNFGGRTCGDVSDVVTIKISIAGEVLANNGEYPCLVGGYPGVVLHNFDGQSYSYTIEALDYYGATLFAASGIFAVDGDVRVIVNLHPVAGPNTNAFIGWRFPANQNSLAPTCAQAGVTEVDVRIDNGGWVTYPCASGFDPEAVLIEGLTAGQHTIEIEAFNSASYRYNRFAGTLTTTIGSSVFVEYTLPWVIGGTAVNWSLPSSNSCYSGTGISAYVNFKDVQTGQWVYPAEGDPLRCSDGVGAGASVRYNYLTAGTYEVWATAMNSSLQWLVPSAPLQRVTIAAGEFVSSSSPPLTVLLY